MIAKSAEEAGFKGLWIPRSSAAADETWGTRSDQ